MDKMKHRINNERFSIRLCNVANTYGFKTVGTMLKALLAAQPYAKWALDMGYARSSQLIKELQEYLNE